LFTAAAHQRAPGYHASRWRHPGSRHLPARIITRAKQGVLIRKKLITERIDETDCEQIGR